MKILDIRLMAAAGFVLLIFLFWFWKAPTPRFGVGVFVLFFPVLFLFFHGKALYMSENMSKLLQATVAIGVLVFICRIGVPWGKITSGNMMTFNYLTAPKPPTVKDKVFGVRPAEGDQCWLVPDCAPNSRPPKTSQNGRDVFYSN